MSAMWTLSGNQELLDTYRDAPGPVRSKQKESYTGAAPDHF